MFCFPTNVEARCWCVVVIIFLHNGSKRVIKGNKSRSREKYVKVRGVRFLRASVFIMRVGRFHARVSTLLVLFWSFLFTPTKTTTRDETRAYLDLLFHRHHIFYRFFSVSFKRGLSFSPPTSPPPRKKTAFVKPVQFFPPKKRILCLGCKICKDFFFFVFLWGKECPFRGGGVSCTKQKMSP